MIDSIGLEMADGRKELLVPAAQQNPAAVLQILQPGPIVFDIKMEGPAIGTDKVIKRTLNLISQQISIFFQQQDLALHSFILGLALIVKTSLA